MDMFTSALIFLLCLTPNTSVAMYILFQGPKENETQRYRVCPIKTQPCSHCYYCDPLVLTDSSYEYKQDVLCNQYYRHKHFSEVLLPNELTNNKIPVCNVGQVPGCGTPPQDYSRQGLYWYCDPGYSNRPHSVYFSCALICNNTSTVAYEYYCNESLEWELTEVSNSSCQPNVSLVVWADASTTKNDTVTLIIVCTVTGVAVAVLAIIIGLAILIWRIRKRRNSRPSCQDEAVQNGNIHVPNGFPKMNNTNLIEMVQFDPSRIVRSEFHDRHQTSVKTCDDIIVHEPSTLTSLLTNGSGKSLQNSTSEGTSKVTPCMENKMKNEPKTYITIHYRAKEKPKWEKCLPTDSVYGIPEGTKVTILIDPKQAKCLHVEKENGNRISGEYQAGNSCFAMDSKTVDIGGKYLCKYSVLSNNEEMSEHFELKILMKKVNNDKREPDSIYKKLDPRSFESKDSGLDSSQTPVDGRPVDHAANGRVYIPLNVQSLVSARPGNDPNCVKEEDEHSPFLPDVKNTDS